MFQLIENTNQHETNALIIRAYMSAADEEEKIVNIVDMKFHLNNELVDTVTDDVIDFFDDFGYEIDSENITPEMLEISGAKPPKLDLEAVRQIFKREKICFIEKGFIYNDPQVSLLTTKGTAKHEERKNRINL